MRKSTSLDVFIKGSYLGGISWALIILRLVMGILFFVAGWSKLMIDDGWSAAGYLQQATGPFASWFQSLAGNVVVNQLNIWGLLLIGLSLFFGLFIRPAAFFGVLIMLLYYFSDFVGNTAYGLIDKHIVYAAVLFLFFVGGFGHIFGIDGLIERRLDQRHKWIRVFFG